MKTINITVEGGVIQDIWDIPEGVEIRIVDYDCEEEVSKDFPNVRVNADGDRYYESIWGHTP